MALLWIAGVCAALLAAAGVDARLPDGRAHANQAPRPSIPIPPEVQVGPVTSRNGTTLPPYNTTYYFNQLIDHNDPSKGTFVQRYWHTWEFYEEGGPIILMTPGEVNADGEWFFVASLDVCIAEASSQAIMAT